jgi:hypothetical protein
MFDYHVGVLGLVRPRCGIRCSTMKGQTVPRIVGMMRLKNGELKPTSSHQSQITQEHRFSEHSGPYRKP